MGTEPLFTSARFGAIELQNRIVMAPLTRSRADKLGVPAKFAADYYAQRASAGLIVTEATQISFEGMGYARTPGIHTTEQLAGWKRVVDAVHANGGKIVSQLWHVGRIAHPLNRGLEADVVSASAVKASGQIWTDEKGLVDHPTPRALNTEEIARIAQAYATAAEHAISIGFDGVEFHSANGYLPMQFLSSNVNKRDDRYGGSIENRARMPLEALAAILRRVPHERVGVRISPGHTFNDIEEADLVALYTHYIARLDRLGLAYLHVSRPGAKIDLDTVALARRHFGGPIIACGGYDAASAAELVHDGGANAVAFGQAYLANPDLAERLKGGFKLNKPDTATFYTPGEKGYTDYPALAAAA